MAGIENQPDGVIQSPSWGALSLGYFHRLYQHVPFGGIPGLYGASGQSKPEVRVFEHSGTLIAKGALFDRIRFAGRDIPFFQAGTATQFFLALHIIHAISVFLTFPNVKALVGATPNYPTGELMDEVLWRTLIGNRTTNLNEALATYRDEYDRWTAKLFAA